jgi:HAD superfamily hydrolase (TIGR01509 family)
VKVAGVVFDCDGVLADSDQAWHAVEVEFCARHGVDRSSLDVDTHGLSMFDSVALLMAGRPDVNPSEVTPEFIDLAATVVPRQVRALPGAREAVAGWQRIAPVAVASNSPRTVLTAVLDAIDVAGLLIASVAADEVSWPKPAPDVYIAACARLGVDPEQVLVFEDSVAGALAAFAAGCRVVQVGARGSAPIPGALAMVGTRQMGPSRARWIS